MVNPKIEQQQTCILPPKILGKLTALNILLPITRQKKSLPLLTTFSNARIDL